MKQKLLAVICSLAVITGCASTTTEYYQAVEAAAQANAAASQAKFDALSAIAAAGDGQAASAAVMALALTQTPTVTPIPQQSQAFQWASILAAPISNLGMMWMQTDSTKTMAKYNSQVDLARISAESANQQALYGSFVSSNQITGDVATAGMTAMGNVDYTPFVDGMVSLGTAGIDGTVALGTAGFDANTGIATAGFDSNVAISTVGLNTAGQLGVTGMDNLTNLGAAGMLNLTTLGQSGITGVLNMGTAGIDGIESVSLEGFDTLMAMDADNNDLYGTVWTQYQQSIQNILNTIPNCTATIAADGSQTVVCN